MAMYLSESKRWKMVLMVRGEDEDFGVKVNFRGLSDTLDTEEAVVSHCVLVSGFWRMVAISSGDPRSEVTALNLYFYSLLFSWGLLFEAKRVTTENILIIAANPVVNATKNPAVGTSKAIKTIPTPTAIMHAYLVSFLSPFCSSPSCL